MDIVAQLLHTNVVKARMRYPRKAIVLVGGRRCRGVINVAGIVSPEEDDSSRRIRLAYSELLGGSDIASRTLAGRRGPPHLCDRAFTSTRHCEGHSG